MQFIVNGDIPLFIPWCLYKFTRICIKLLILENQKINDWLIDWLVKMMLFFLLLSQLQSQQRIGYEIRTLMKIRLSTYPPKFLGTND